MPVLILAMKHNFYKSCCQIMIVIHSISFMKLQEIYVDEDVSNDN